MSEREKFPAGTRLGENGRYELREPIGKGAMAEVYKAVDTRLNGRLVAVKTLSSSVENHTHKDRMRALFIEEAQALSRVNDDNVVAVLDSGITPGGTPYMVMEFLNGQDLGQLLKKEERLSLDRAVEIALGVCAGVHASHLAGIIHRDVKPANIFLDLTLKGEQTKVVDFSVAKIPLAGQQVEKDHTRTDLVVGTPTYMSPEQALGKPATALSDQYSIGAILYRCLTGRVPHGVLPSLSNDRSDVPEALEAVILRAMDARPEARFPSVFELGRAIEPFASAAGRAKWKAYYTTPPVPVGPAFVGPVQPPPKADVSPTAVKPYDFRAHERTTKVNKETFLEGTTTTVDLQGPSTIGGGAPTTIENSARKGRLAGTPRSERGDSAAPRPGSGERSSSEGGRSARSQRMIVAGAVGLALLILGATAGMRAWRSHRATTTPTPPAWTKSAAPQQPEPAGSVPAPAAAPSPATRAIPVPAPPPSPPSPANAAGPAAEEPDRGGEGASHATGGALSRKKHRKRTSAAVQYTKDGVPLLSPE